MAGKASDAIFVPNAMSAIERQAVIVLVEMCLEWHRRREEERQRQAAEGANGDEHRD